MNRDQWIQEFASAIRTDAPGPDLVDELLELAAVAAHSSERTAAPIACYLAGLSGRSIAELKELAVEIGDGE